MEQILKENISKNNQNAGRLIGKYTELAKESLSKGDKILSENYYQHADHFLRVTNEKNFLKEVTPSVEKKNEENESDETKSANNQLIEEIVSDFKTSTFILLTSNLFLSSPFKILPEGNFNV